MERDLKGFLMRTSTKGVTSTDSLMEKGLFNGLMERSIRAFGRKGKGTDMESGGTLKERSTLENGRTTLQMDLDFTYGGMGTNTRGSGRKARRVEKERTCLQMVTLMWGISIKGSSKALDNTSGRIKAATLVNSSMA
jgi:hypothetical protein